MATEKTKMLEEAVKSHTEPQIYLAQIVFPRETNELEMAKAGVILKAIDIAASLAAGKQAHQKVVTASLDRMDFLNHAYIWELVRTSCRLTKTWKTSLEVEVTVEAEDIRNGNSRQVAQGYLVFVAVDESGLKPTPVPPLALNTPEEIKLAEEAEKRRQDRINEKNQGQLFEFIEDIDNPEVVKRTMTPDDANIHNKVFGGAILEIIHQAAEKASAQHANSPVIAVRQDRMSFEQPAYIGEEVKAQAIITRSWRSAMEVQVEVYARDHKTAEERRIASSYMVFMAQDSKGKPKSVRPFTPSTHKQQLRWEAAELRQQQRLSERTKRS